MSRPRLPQDVAKITGAVAKNAGRFEGRSSPKVRSLGPAPKKFNEEQKRIWDEFNDDYPWLGRSDRQIVGIACRLQYMVETEVEVPVAVFTQLRMTLSAMGGTPVDRSKVGAPDEPDKDPADEYFN